MAGYLRLKYQHWTIDEAIAEMRRYGHVWKKFAKDGTTNSWHENHLRGIAKTLNPAAPAYTCHLWACLSQEQPNTNSWNHHYLYPQFEF